MQKVVTMDGKEFKTPIPLDEVYVLYKCRLKGCRTFLLAEDLLGHPLQIDCSEIDSERTFADAILDSLRDTLPPAA